MVGALDEGMTKICEEHGIPTLSIEANSIKNRGAANLRFDYSAYKRMAAMKVQFYSNILRLGFNVWACDADAIFVTDPRPMMQTAPWTHADIAIAPDCIAIPEDARHRNGVENVIFAALAFLALVGLSAE